MSWRDAVRLSDVAFTELSLQAIYAFRQGNLAPPGPPRSLVARARRRVLQSKAVVSVVLGLLAVGGAFALRSDLYRSPFFPVPITPAVFQAGVLTGLLSLDIAFLWWTGMQVLPTFLASGVLPVLEPLPIEDRTLNRAAGLLYLRLFDLPALTVLVGTPLAVGLALGPTAGAALVPGVVAVVAYSLALSLLTGRFFVRRVQGSRGGGGRTVLRWSLLVLWLVPAFAMFAFVIGGPSFFTWIGNLSQGGPSTTGHLLLAAFPFPLASLPAIAASGTRGLGLDLVGSVVLVAASGGYVILAGWAVAWTVSSVRRVGFVPPGVPLSPTTARLDLHPTGPIRAVVTKDLRIASRTPGYAFLVLLPVLDAIAIGLLTYVRAPGSSAAFGIALAAVVTAALLATFFGPAFFAIEVFAYSYGRTLPLPDRSLLEGKVALVAAMYLVAGGTVLGITLARVFDPVLFAAFILAELPAVVAAALLELGILFRRAHARGLPITNLYAGAWYAFFVSIPGILLAALPLVAYAHFGTNDAYLGLLAMGVVALGELAVTAPLALGRGSS
jgi:Membrane protein of 12 TMs